jgi:hypothetical protein
MTATTVTPPMATQRLGPMVERENFLLSQPQWVQDLLTTMDAHTSIN